MTSTIIKCIVWVSIAVADLNNYLLALHEMKNHPV